jgi:hypothetical protein
MWAKAVEISDILLHSNWTKPRLSGNAMLFSEMSEVNKQQEELDHLHATAFQGTDHWSHHFGTGRKHSVLERKDLVDYTSSITRRRAWSLPGPGG